MWVILDAEPNNTIIKFLVTIWVALSMMGVAAAQDLAKATEAYNAAVAAVDSSRATVITLYEEALGMAEKLGEAGSGLASQCQEALSPLYLSLGNDFIAAGNVDRAIKAFEQAVAYSEDEISAQQLSYAYIVKAVACQKEKNLKGALENAQKSVQHFDNPTAEKIIGMSALSLKQNKVAAEAFEAYLSMTPSAITEEAGIVYNLGLALIAAGENDKACGYFREIAQDAEFGLAARYQIVVLKCE